jgi:hypothetical protein
MSFACPHCTKPIEDVVPRARLDEKTSAIKNQDAKLTALEEQLKAMENVKAEAAQVARLRDELALSRAGIQDERQARRVLGAWKADSEGAEKPPSLTDWMKADGADFLAAFRAAPAAAPADPAAPASPGQAAAPAAGQPAAAASAPAPASAPAAAPLPRDRGAAPPPPPGTGRLTQQQAEQLAAPMWAQYRKAPPERRAEIRKQIDAIVAQVA